MSIGSIVTILIIAVLFIFIITIFIRAFRFQPELLPAKLPGTYTIPRAKAADDLAAMIRCKTVSYRDEALVDRAEFAKFVHLLAERFPLIHQTCTREQIGPAGLLYHWKGKQSRSPLVMMAHYDVVPADEERWERPAFGGLIEDGVLWGRGTLDTKGTLCGILEAVEQLIGDSFVPEQDIYLSFGGDEELDGESCIAIVRWFEEKGIKPGMVVDEGGAIVEGVFPGIGSACAMVGISEKGTVNIECSMEGEGGHASTPPTHTIIGQLSSAVVRLESHPFPAEFTPAVAAMFDTLGRHSGLAVKLIFANLWCFLPLLKLVCRKAGGELNAMMRTTCAVTRMEGSKAYNILPPYATIGLNLRLLGSSTISSALDHLRKVMKNDKINLRLVSGMEASICSDTSGAEWATLKQVIHTTWPDILIAPYLMMGASDSRHYCRITDRVYRFSAMQLSKEERAMIHGHNERIPLESFYKTIEFYLRLIEAYKA
ncbi:MAG: M20/M25/M40 family metallo-hydrolase [Lachnospiraceae bacterium]|nr:M20/M25/M40 family metallo-hydrolase [Lachnospiraceae bacterium]